MGLPSRSLNSGRQIIQDHPRSPRHVRLPPSPQSHTTPRTRSGCKVAGAAVDGPQSSLAPLGGAPRAHPLPVSTQTRELSVTASREDSREARLPGTQRGGNTERALLCALAYASRAHSAGHQGAAPPCDGNAAGQGRTPPRSEGRRPAGRALPVSCTRPLWPTDGAVSVPLAPHRRDVRGRKQPRPAVALPAAATGKSVAQTRGSVFSRARSPPALARVTPRGVNVPHGPGSTGGSASSRDRLTALGPPMEGPRPPARPPTLPASDGTVNGAGAQAGEAEALSVRNTLRASAWHAEI